MNCRHVFFNGAMWHVHFVARNNQRRLAQCMITTTQGTHLWSKGFKMRFRLVRF